MTESATLNEIFADARQPHLKRGCPICGGKNEALVQVSVRELTEKGQTGTASRNVSVSLCGDHAAETWIALSSDLDAVR
jgi:hypothetical protein